MSDARPIRHPGGNCDVLGRSGRVLRHHAPRRHSHRHHDGSGLSDPSTLVSRYLFTL